MPARTLYWHFPNYTNQGSRPAGAIRDGDLAALRMMRFMSDFREAMWGVLQSGISELDFDFNGYAAKHFARMESTASELQLNT